MSVARILTSSFGFALVAGGIGCSTLVTKGVNEARGGRGSALPVKEVAGKALDKYGRVEIGKVEVSPDAGPIPAGLPKLVESALTRRIAETGLFRDPKGPVLTLHVRLTTRWQASGAEQALSAFSEI